MKTFYNGFYYEPIGDGVWRITLPSKLKAQIEALDEDEVRARIDEIIANFAGV